MDNILLDKLKSNNKGLIFNLIVASFKYKLYGLFYYNPLFVLYNYASFVSFSIWGSINIKGPYFYCLSLIGVSYGNKISQCLSFDGSSMLVLNVKLEKLNGLSNHPSYELRISQNLFL